MKDGIKVGHRAWVKEVLDALGALFDNFHIVYIQVHSLYVGRTIDQSDKEALKWAAAFQEKSTCNLANAPTTIVPVRPGSSALPKFPTGPESRNMSLCDLVSWNILNLGVEADREKYLISHRAAGLAEERLHQPSG